MKKLMLIVALAVGMVACHDEKADWVGTGSGGDKLAVGYIAFADGGLTVNVDKESAAGDLDADATRAEEAGADYTVEVWSAENDLVASFKYGERESQYTTSSIDPARKGIAVPVGRYTIKAYSAATPKESDTPQYAGQTTVAVAKETVTEANITCELSSVKVSVRFDPILASLITDDTKARVVLGAEDVSEYTFVGRPVTPLAADASVANGCSKMDWGAEGGYRYLRPNEEVNPLTLYFTANYNGSAIKDQALKICDDAKPGEWRQVTVKLENGDSGQIYVVIEVKTWVEGEIVDVDVTSMSLFGGEVVIPDDTDAPVIEWTDHDLAEPFTLADDMFDSNGNFTAGADFTVVTKSEITAMSLGLTSTNSDLNEVANDLGLSAEGGISLTGTLSSMAKMILGSWGFPISNVAGQKEITFNLATLMKELHANYAGTHTFTITVEDKLGSETTVELGITSGIVVDPNIVWVGKDIDQVYNLKEVDQISVLITAKNKIKDIRVSIKGPLAPDLQNMMMPAEFGLVEPGTLTDGTGSLADILTGFGFPTGYDDPATAEEEGVYDRTSVPFTISSMLMNMMGSFYSQDENDYIEFEITVIDQSGDEVNGKLTKSIKLLNLNE